MAEDGQLSEVQSGKDPEAALGGADNVDKTTYTSPRAAEAAEGRGSTAGTTARVSSGGGLGTLAWVVAGLTLAAFGLYAAGVL